MLIEKDYCDYETCVALVELGMRITSRKVYSDRDTLKHSSRGVTYTVRTASAMGWVIAIPLYEAQKWLREEHNLHIEITYTPLCWTGKIYDLKECNYIKGFTFFKSFEETLHTLIKEAVKILKEK